MDARPADAGDDPVVVTGLGHALPAPGEACDPLPFLKVKKLRKYMGVQDDLAVVAASKALESAGLLPRSVSEGLGERTGLYLVVGYIPFEKADLDPLVEASLDDGHFSMQRFSTAGFRAVNGLLTFRCLPNMPAFHVSANFDIQGPYFVTYPGPGQFYLALEEAMHALAESEIDLALVGGVAHQRNFLVEYHFGRVAPPAPAERLRDAAGFVVLERESTARRRGALVRGWLREYGVGYQRHDPFEDPPVPLESIDAPCAVAGELGPASLAVALCLSAGRRAVVCHSLESRDGLRGCSLWDLL